MENSDSNLHIEKVLSKNKRKGKSPIIEMLSYCITFHHSFNSKYNEDWGQFFRRSKVAGVDGANRVSKCIFSLPFKANGRSPIASIIIWFL